jgi:hypothetical protein
MVPIGSGGRLLELIEILLCDRLERSLATGHHTRRHLLDALLGCPVILEYKRAMNENVVNQGLFYLDWLMDHRKDFQWLVLRSSARRTRIRSIGLRLASSASRVISIVTTNMR